jgi:hypothetical protein
MPQAVQNFRGELTGKVISRRWAHGSKSERVVYFICFDDPLPRVGKALITERRLELKGENPFDQSTLKKLDGKRIRARGGHWINDLWRAEAIEELKTPPPRKKKTLKIRSPRRVK